MPRLTARTLLLAAATAALVVFCAVQDRVVADGVGRYVQMKRDAMAGRGPDVGVDQVLGPAVRDSVRRGAAWAGGMFVTTCGLAMVLRRRGSGRR